MLNRMEFRVNSGMHFMGMHFPGWMRKVNPKTLDMSNPNKDVLSDHAMLPLEMGVPQTSNFDQFVRVWGWRFVVDHGFAAAEGESYEDLTAEWATRISLRQSQYINPPVF